MIKRIKAWALVTAMIIAALCTLADPAIAANEMVARCNLRLRKEASTKSDTLVVIPGGTELQVLSTSGGWVKSTYKGHTGYVAADYLMELTRSGYYPLREGDENPYVKEMQERLIQLGYLSGKADGKYGTSTLVAVKAFQKNHGIKQDGIAGGETQRTMFAADARYATGVISDSSGTETSSTPTANTEGGSPTASGTTLKLGSRGDDVKTLQQRLIQLGYLSGKADGIFGKSTEKAIIDFQKRSSLTADGKAGSVTQNLLYSNGAKDASGAIASTAESSGDTATASETTYATLKKGMTNSSVKKMQQALKDLGYLSASATGYFGSSTYEALTKFQKANGLKVDGIAGTETQRVLYGTGAMGAGNSNTNTESSTSTAADALKPYTTLREGMKSSAVTTLQKKLKELGYLSASATGFFGTATKQAVVSFQKAHGLSADGVAGSLTLNILYGTGAKSAGSGGSGSSAGSVGAGKIAGPPASSVKLLHWFNSVKPSIKGGNILQVYDPATGYGWKIRVYSPGRHCDSEPVTAEDTLYMNAAFGGVSTWTPKPVYVMLPSGTWTMATTHNVPHLSGSVKENNFDGHLCVHFLRDMDEVTKNDPSYGVQNQKVLREAWKKLTGQTIN